MTAFDHCRLCGASMLRREYRCARCGAERQPSADELLDMLDDLSHADLLLETRGWTGSYCGPDNSTEGL